MAWLSVITRHMPRRADMLTVCKSSYGSPALIIHRAWHSDLGIFPDNGHWKQPSKKGFIGTCGFLVRRDVHQKHIQTIGTGHYASDYDLVSSIYRIHEHSVVWVDRLMCWALKRSLGA